MKIDVTESDIDAGLRGSCRFCPVALAIQRALDRGDVKVAPKTANIGEKIYFFPESVPAFIRRFDSRTSNVYPFSFELEGPWDGTLGLIKTM